MVGNSYQVIPGSYVYSPAVGAVLPVGTHSLQVTFLPTDLVNFNPAVATGHGHRYESDAGTHQHQLLWPTA